jgi:hypothetical protein
MIRRGSPPTINAADAARTTGRAGPRSSTQAAIEPKYQPVIDQRIVARVRFFMVGVSGGSGSQLNGQDVPERAPIGGGCRCHDASRKGGLQGQSGRIAGTSVIVRRDLRGSP